MFQLVYLSTSSRSFTSEKLADLLEKSRSKNLQMNITGLLLYRENRFIQVIEGDEKIVRMLYASICRDSRHHGLIPVIQQTIAVREFPDWSMGFRDLDGLNKDAMAGFSEFLNTPQDISLSAWSATQAKKLLKLFKQSR